MWDLRPADTLTNVPPEDIARATDAFDAFTAGENSNFVFDTFVDPDLNAQAITKVHDEDIFDDTGGKQKSKSKSESKSENIYEVELILNHRIVAGNHEYLIKWKKFDNSYNTWEPVNNLNCPALIQEYWSHTVRTKPLKPMLETLKQVPHKLFAGRATEDFKGAMPESPDLPKPVDSSELVDSSETANSPQPDPRSAYLEWCNINDNSSAIHPPVNESNPKPSYAPNRRSNRVPPIRSTPTHRL